jgi:hypothetical protein
MSVICKGASQMTQRVASSLHFACLFFFFLVQPLWFCLTVANESLRSCYRFALRRQLFGVPLHPVGIQGCLGESVKRSSRPSI